MKTSELFETIATADIKTAVFSAIDAAMDHSSALVAFDTFGDEIGFSVSYDSPEHRIGKSKEVRAAFKGHGKVKAYNGGGMYNPGTDYQLELTSALEPEEAAKLKAKVKAKYKLR